MSSLHPLNSGGNTAKYFILYILNILKRAILLIYVIVIIISNYCCFVFLILACQMLHAFTIYPDKLPCWLFFFFFSPFPNHMRQIDCA